MNLKAPSAAAPDNLSACHLPVSSSELISATQAAFAPNGALAQSGSPYRPRSAQQAMAIAIAETIEAGGSLVVEAGTGIGKTFAYLVPALLSGKRVLVSTATKTLQDQLYGRDLPQVMQALGLAANTALLKGRASYLCTWRMREARQQNLSAAQLKNLVQIERWARHTSSGDFAELSGLDERASILPWVSSTRENCLGQNCPDYKECHVVKARREAMQADIVIINHHLFFADMAVRESGVAELLPTVGVVVFDEAHQLNETGVQFLGQRIASSQLLDLCRDTLACGLQRARGLLDWQELVSTLEYATRELRLVIGSNYNKGQGTLRLRWADAHPENLDATQWSNGLNDVITALAGLAAALDTVTEISPDLARLHERALDLQVRTQHFARAKQSDGVRWLEVSTHWNMVEAPLDIAKAMQSRFQPAQTNTEQNFKENMPIRQQKRAQAATNFIANNDDWKTFSEEAMPTLPSLAALVPLQPGAESADAANHEACIAQNIAWVFTSATLGDEASLNWFTQPCGLQHARTLRLPSPFNYAEQAALYLPDMPAASDTAAHSKAVAELAAQSARILGGRTLVLTTTTRALRVIAEQLSALLQGSGIAVLEQGNSPKSELIAKLRNGASAQDAADGFVLVATASLWEGVDIAGDALQLVIIDKLPFPPPGDPLIEARGQRLQAEGKSPFNQYAMPEAAVALKQGAGRLIRSESDRGALVVCDVRLTQTAYGKRLLKGLPSMRKLYDSRQYEAYLDALKNKSLFSIDDRMQNCI